MVPSGIVLAFAPTIYILAFVILYFILLIFTSPIRLWCVLRLRMMRMSGNPVSDAEIRLEGIVEKLNRMGEWCFDRW